MGIRGQHMRHGKTLKLKSHCSKQSKRQVGCEKQGQTKRAAIRQCPFCRLKLKCFRKKLEAVSYWVVALANELWPFLKVGVRDAAITRTSSSA